MDIDRERLGDRDFFDHWCEEEVRYRDLDTNGHVNNSVFCVYCETARLSYRRSIVAGLCLPSSVAWVVAAFGVEYYRPVHYPGRLRIGVRPLAVGRTSFTLGYGLFDAEAQLAAAAVSRSVCIDRASGRSTELPEALREKLLSALPAT